MPTTRMRVNVGEYRNSGDAYFRVVGRSPSFENNQKGKGAPTNTRTQRSYTLVATPHLNVLKFWFVDGNGLLYSRNIDVQYVQPTNS